MKKLLTLVAIAGLGLSTIGCAEKPAAPPATPAVTPAPGGDAPAAAPADTTPPSDEKK